MNLGKGEFRVFFSIKNMRAKKRFKLEAEIEDLLKSFGYNRWASGIDRVNRVRDLAFDKELRQKKSIKFIETKNKIKAIVK